MVFLTRLLTCPALLGLLARAIIPLLSHTQAGSGVEVHLAWDKLESDIHAISKAACTHATGYVE